MSLPVVWLGTPLGAGFSEKYPISPLSILRHFFDVVSLNKALYSHMLHLTQALMSTLKDRDLTVCMLSVELNGTRINRSSDQGLMSADES